MIDFLKEWVLNIVILAVILVIIEMMIPSGKIKKYVSLISGFVLIIALITPFLKVFKTEWDIKEYYTNSENFIDRKEIELGSRNLEEKQTEQIIEIYRKKLIDQIEENALSIKGVKEADADVIINENYNGENFGEIKRIYLALRLSDNDSIVEPVSKVKKVQIGKEEIPGNKKEIDPKVKEQLEEKIIRAFGVSKENIVITLQER